MTGAATMKTFDFLEADPSLRSRRVIQKITGSAARPYALAGLAALLVVLVACFYEWQLAGTLRAQYDALSAQHQALTARPAKGGLMLRQIETLSTEARAHRRSNYEAAETLDEIARHSPSHFWFTKLAYTPTTVSINGTARDGRVFRKAQSAFSGLQTVQNPFPDSLAPSGRFFTFSITLDKGALPK